MKTTRVVELEVVRRIAQIPHLPFELTNIPLRAYG